MRKMILFSLFTLCFSPLPLKAAEKIWKQNNNPANYIDLESIKDSVAEDLILNHPYHIDAKKITDMLLSVRYNKALLFRKDIKDQQVFFDTDLVEKKFAPRIEEAFQKASPNQVVVVSMVQKDPFFVLRNDRLSVFKMFVAQDGMHIKFMKTDSHLSGDYQAHTTGTKLIQGAKGMKISLEPQPGQKLSFADAQEVILDLNYDFAALVDKKAEEETEKEKEKNKRVKRSDSSTTSTAASSTKAPSSEVKKAPAERLKDLKALKEQGLISPAEYEAKKKEILKDL
ncbi:MAG: SHOCT domain-containing protein [Deltaproteobacteria bacterium]|nr:SHOCT domain-containing protein [Deltaproteobacteria bacterium]